MSLFEVAEQQLGSLRKYYGKYRATVFNNLDPFQMGRIQVVVPDVSNIAISSWALPCLPWCGPQQGIMCVPPIGAGVWVEFEQGDPDYPVWTGCFWGSAGEVPSGSRVVAPSLGITIQTLGQNMIQLSELGIILKTRSGAMLSITDAGIVITNGAGATISMVANTVDINGGALTIM